MAKLSRKGDANAVGGKIVRGASTVFANGIQVGLHVSDITKHPGGGKHNAAKLQKAVRLSLLKASPFYELGQVMTAVIKLLKVVLMYLSPKVTHV